MNEHPAAGRRTITAPDAPPAVGPYSHAVAHGGLLYCSGSIALRGDSGELVDESIGAETTQCLENLTAVCRAGGTELSRALRLTIYTTRLEEFAAINEAYAAFFPSDPPARVTFGVVALPLGATVEIDAVVALP